MTRPTEAPVCLDAQALATLANDHRGITDPDICATVATDWTGHWTGHTPAVFRPADTAALAALVRDAQALRIPVQIQGGNTSLTGGATPYGEATVNTTQLRQLDVDETAGRATVGAGVTAGELRSALAGTGWELGVDLASRDSATIGGMISTNTGGLRVLRWGQMANQVIGAQAVLGDGTTIDHLDPPDRDNTGPRWHQLLAGAEGTLGVITAATLRLVPVEKASTALVAFDSISDAITAALNARRSIAGLRSVELMEAAGIALVAEHTGNQPPLGGPQPAYLLIDAAGDIDTFTAAAAAATPTAIAAAVTDGTGQAELWQWRERHTESIAAAGIARKCDISAPPANLTALADRVISAALRHSPDATVIRFGHIAEGNIHVNLLDADEAAEAAVLSTAAELGGSISAEHGIGRQKRRLLALARSADEIATIAKLRAAVDPAGILNPNICWPA